MGDEFDGCECIWSHELAMRRLLTLLRQNQNYCTDTECVDLPASNPDGMGTGFTTMTMFIVFAVILYMMRPRSLRRNAHVAEKPLANRPGGSDDGGPPPPTVG
ncbi:small integral membrane protein 14 [Phlebotomus argentipes]|uniref:small integral membrane protein 14 n=1 Tax=Phlebotomus argentipes TaxID=94469 RepID=UPI002892B4F5|nr:small integral membrane protein 14 [Phlebotomus argentipes]XP_059613636.1 small integral membrane protein 14 [Phlebotomus argentipes]